MAKILVAEGDSWFALSDKKLLKIGGIRRTDVINELEKLGYDDIESVADISDTIESMAYSDDHFKKFKDELQELDDPPCAILLSGGGNDITGKALEMMLNDQRSDSYSSNPLNEKVVNGVIDGHLQEAYLKLLKKIDDLCKDTFKNENQKKIPVLVHGYAYPIPDGRSFANKKSEGNLLVGLFELLDPLIEKDIPGPWLRSAFENRSYSRLKETTCIMAKLVDLFNCMLKRLCNENFCKICVKHVDVRDCFKKNAQDNNKDYMKNYEKYWDDEFHPSEKGFKLIAEQFDKVIKEAIENLTPNSDPSNRNEVRPII